MLKIKTILVLIVSIFLSGICSAQQNKNDVIQPAEAPIETKLGYSVWRTDYYICTGIAFAKKNGKTVEDFTEFVGNIHRLGNNLDDAVNVMCFVTKTYPNGEAIVHAKSDTTATVRINRPWSDYFKGGMLLGVTLEEFESYLFGHLIIMGEKIDLRLNFKYEGTNHVIITIEKIV